MNIKELLKGVVVIIDDEIELPEANIKKIIEQLDNDHYPILKYEGLDEVDIEKLSTIAFLILDWELKGTAVDKNDTLSGVKLGETKKGNIADNNIEFIKKLISTTFCPIFIFSNQDTGDIKKHLTEAIIISDDKPSRFFIKSKRDVEDTGRLFEEIEQWIKNSPAVYVLKELENEHQKVLNELFNDFQDNSPFWPFVLWKCYKDDGANPSLELKELLTRNLHNRMSPFQFCGEILEKDFTPSQEEIRKVLEGEKFLPNERLLPDDIGTGDLFKIDDDKGEYYLLNIRPQCDLIRSKKVVLYCLKRKARSNSEEINDFSKENGLFIEKINNVIVPFVDDKVIIFSFRDVHQKPYSEIKEKRIGRLLPPYITLIQQRYAFYSQRQGLPRIPYEALYESNQKEV